MDRLALRTLAAGSLSVIVVVAPGRASEDLIPRVPFSDPSPTCHPDPACAGEGRPMASYAVTTGGIEGRTGDYVVTAFRVVLSEPSVITRFEGVGTDGGTDPDWSDFAGYVNVFSSLDAFAADPLTGDVVANAPLDLHEEPEPFGDDPAVFYVELEAEPFDLGVGTHVIAVHVDRRKGTFAWNESTVDLGSDVFATSESPGVHFAWADEGYDPGTVAIDVWGIAGATTCPADLDQSGDVGFDDLLAILVAWGPCPDHCPQDLDDDDVVGPGDLLILTEAWGPCP